MPNEVSTNKYLIKSISFKKTPLLFELNSEKLRYLCEVGFRISKFLEENNAEMVGIKKNSIVIESNGKTTEMPLGKLIENGKISSDESKEDIKWFFEFFKKNAKKLAPVKEDDINKIKEIVKRNKIE